MFHYYYDKKKKINFVLTCWNHYYLFVLVRYSGFYKGVQSAGAAVAWQVDTHKVHLVTQLVVNWCLTTVSYPLLVLLVILAVKDEDTAVVAGKDEEKQPVPAAKPSGDASSLTVDPAN